jgi:hypothetical protein
MSKKQFRTKNKSILYKNIFLLKLVIIDLTWVDVDKNE